MPNARDRIRLTEAEQEELLAGARILQIASILPDGRPHVVPMWFARDDEGLLKAKKRARRKQDWEENP